MSNVSEQEILDVHHWTDSLFSFKTTRDSSFRYQSGQFVMIGLMVGERPLMRAYSLASAHYDDELEFFSIKVPDGPLTSRLREIAPGDRILVGRKATGTLLLDNLLPGRNLFLVGTGTGLAPFLSIIKDPDTYERFDKIVLVHGVRHVKELVYGETISSDLPRHELIGDMVREKLIYYPTVTREPFRNRGRITDLLVSAKLTSDAGLAPLSAEQDRVMLCGSPQMLDEMVTLLGDRAFVEGSGHRPGSYVIEKAFVEK